MLTRVTVIEGAAQYPPAGPWIGRILHRPLKMVFRLGLAVVNAHPGPGAGLDVVRIFGSLRVERL
jgi:hypothetical protein